MSARMVRLDHLTGVYRVGSGDWPWKEEYENLIGQAGTQKLLTRIGVEGIREPILLGTDGRVWDGHHRIVIAMHLGLDSVPVEFVREDGALAALRAEWEAEQGAEEPEWEYGNEQLMHSHVEVFPASSEAVAKAQAWLWPMYRRRKAGPWEAVPTAE